MKEFRREVPLHKPASDYAWVELGPLPGVPDWHIQAEPSHYPFPTDLAAVNFAVGCKGHAPDREVAVIHLDGQRIEIGA